MLKLLNEQFHLNLSEEQLEIYAATLGADCAFFIKNKPVYAEGIGNIFSPIELSLKGYQIMIVKPDVFVSTREAFANIHPHHPEYPVKEVIHRPVAEWKDTLINDFEASVFPQHPVIGEIKQELYNQGSNLRIHERFRFFRVRAVRTGCCATGNKQEARYLLL